MYGRAEIEAHIPQRDPFLFVDEVVAFEAHRRARGRLRLTGEESFLRGHFPARPLMPGVLILEHMAQTANFLLARSTPAERRQMVLGGVERARFLEPVRPGDELLTDIEVIKLFESKGLVEAESRVRGQVVARARFQFAALGG